MNKITKLTWDTRGSYDSGLDRGVLYYPGRPGEAWNGLVSLTETEQDSLTRPLYLDGFRVISRQKDGQFSGVIAAFTYPDAFNDLLVSRRPVPFGLAYRSANRIHILYNVLISPTPTVRAQTEVETFNWGFSTKPLEMPEGRRSAQLIVDCGTAYSWTVEALEGVLYGTDAAAPRLPTPQEVMDIFEENSILQVIDHGDGSFTVMGPDEAIQMLDATTFQITWPSAEYLDAETYTIHSL